MPTYRIYTLDDDRLVVKARVVEAKTDAAAVVLAESMLDGRDLEIWTGMRRVGHVSAPVDSTEPQLDF